MSLDGMNRINGEEGEIAAEVASLAHQHAATYELDRCLVGKRSLELEPLHRFAQRGWRRAKLCVSPDLQFPGTAELRSAPATDDSVPET